MWTLRQIVIVTENEQNLPTRSHQINRIVCYESCSSSKWQLVHLAKRTYTTHELLLSNSRNWFAKLFFFSSSTCARWSRMQCINKRKLNLTKVFRRDLHFFAHTIYVFRFHIRCFSIIWCSGSIRSITTISVSGIPHHFYYLKSFILFNLSSSSSGGSRRRRCCCRSCVTHTAAASVAH